MRILREAALVDLRGQAVDPRHLAADCSNANNRLIAVTSGDARVECVAVHPMPIFVLGEVVAVVNAVPLEWTKFQWIDLRSQTWWLIEKRDRNLLSSSSAPLTNQTVSQFAPFGFTHVAATGDTQDLKDPALALSTDALLHAAFQAVEHGSSAAGCHLHRDDSGHQILSLNATQPISYQVVHVTQPVFSTKETALVKMTAGRPVLLVVDEAVEQLYGSEIDKYAATFLKCAAKTVFKATEQRKNGTEVARLCWLAASLGFPRHGIFVAIGGGITLDVVGLAASVYCRGIGYLRIPTTLVGLIDAGIGIKQAVNFAGRKNLVGAFYPPLGVINDATFLRTLPLEEISCGMSEMIKIALVRDEELFKQLEMYCDRLRISRFSDPLQVAPGMLLRSSMLMLEELQPNLYEADKRRLVDLGHSFSPSIEALSDYGIPHGDAVAMDMHLSTAIAVQRGLCPPQFLLRLGTLLRNSRLPDQRPPCTPEQLLSALNSTRQRRGGRLNLVVPTGPGTSAFLQDVTLHEIEKALSMLDADRAECAQEMHAGSVN